MVEVLIVGAGPAGLLAAKGAHDAGADITIIDADPSFRPERIFSLQYLHEACGLEDKIRELWIKYEYQWEGRDKNRQEADTDAALIDGVRRAYNRKLQRPDEEENSTRFLWSGPTRAWSLRDAYSILWKQFEPSIHREAIHNWKDLLSRVGDPWQLVISTVPLPKLLPEWTWPVRNGYIAMGYTPIGNHPPNTCVYNLDPTVPWYRATHLDGGIATEFTLDMTEMDQYRYKTKFTNLRKVAAGAVIPEHPWKLLLTGRWGSWDPSKLTHHAYDDAMRLVSRWEGQ